MRVSCLNSALIRAPFNVIAQSVGGRSVSRDYKPTGLVGDAIQDVTRRGDLVLDRFLGSGTTLIAAERTGRHLKAHPKSPLDGSCESACSIELTSVTGGVGRIVPMRGQPQHQHRKGQNQNRSCYYEKVFPRLVFRPANLD